MTAQAKQPRPAILWSTQVGIPFRSAQDDVRYTRQGFSIIDDGRPAPQSHDSREGRADARYAALSFQRFHQRGLFPNFVRARAAVPVHFKPVLNPAPPRPRKPEFLTSLMMPSGCIPNAFWTAL